LQFFDKYGFFVKYLQNIHNIHIERRYNVNWL